MTNIFQKFTFVATSTIISFAVINTNFVNAASIIYDFEVNNLDGSLAGETFSGFFEFDDSGLTGMGDESLSVSQINFDFLGVNYTETDGFSVAVFFDGEFLGLDFTTDVEFSFVQGLFDVGEAFFAYNIPELGDGAGDITYTLRPEAPTSVPEPTAIFGLLALGVTGCNSLLKKTKKL